MLTRARSASSLKEDEALCRRCDRVVPRDQLGPINRMFCSREYCPQCVTQDRITWSYAGREAINVHVGSGW